MSIDNKNQISKGYRLIVIYVEYGRSEASDLVFNTLRGYLDAIINCSITYLRIDNKYENKNYYKESENIYIFGGDNSFREFSGWQRGLYFSKIIEQNADCILFVNEMILKPGETFLKDYAVSALTRSVDENKIIGRIDSSGKSYTLFGYDVSRWICTNCFFAPAEATNKVKNLVQINDNIYDIMPRKYNPSHLVYKGNISFADSSDGNFTLTINASELSNTDIRIVPSKNFVPAKYDMSDDERELSIYINNISYSGIQLKQENFIRGFYDYPEEHWIGKSMLFSLPDKNDNGRLMIDGYVPSEIFKNIYDKQMEITIYNDSALFNNNAPINDNYKRGLVHWLTELWHSRFEPSEETWDKFIMKASAIFNEALLTAKFSELGYEIESYGEYKYY